MAIDKDLDKIFNLIREMLTYKSIREFLHVQATTLETEELIKYMISPHLDGNKEKDL
jgi:hypothetical protein